MPEDGAFYNQDRARDGIRSVLDGLGIAKAHIVGLSMGGFAALHFGFTYADRALSLTIGGCGYGAAAKERTKFAAETEAKGQRFDDLGMEEAAPGYALGPTRVQFQNRDPRGWQEFADHLVEQSARGAPLTIRGVQAKRPSLFDLTDRMQTISVPTLIMTRTRRARAALERIALLSCRYVEAETDRAYDFQAKAGWHLSAAGDLCDIKLCAWR